MSGPIRTRIGLRCLCAGLAWGFDAGVAQAEIDHAAVRVHIAIADGHGQPYQLPRGGEIRIGTNEWCVATFPHLEVLHDLSATDLAVRVPGYDDPAAIPVAPAIGETIDVIFRLDPQIAQVSIDCDTPDARIYDKDAEVGRPGVPLLLAPFRKYNLTIRAPGHRDAQIVLDHPEPGCSPCIYHVNLERIPATLRILADNPNRFRRLPKAEIWIDDVPVATAFLPHVVGSLTQDQARVTVRLAGFRDSPVQPVVLRPGEQSEVLFALEYPDSYFDFRIQPSNAVVRVGEELVTTNPYPVIPNRIYAIRIDAPGHRGQTVQGAAPPGETQRVAVVLVPRAVVEFDLAPDTAVVFMAGRRITDRVVEVSPDTTYTLDIRAPGYESQNITLSVAAGETKTVRAHLKKRLLPF